jgi:hypothetical protein
MVVFTDHADLLFPMFDLRRVTGLWSYVPWFDIILSLNMLVYVEP